MHEKPVKLPMEFGEALARLARVPKPAPSIHGHKKVDKSPSLAENQDGAQRIAPRAARARKRPSSG
jgi:hypothetical protein